LRKSPTSPHYPIVVLCRRIPWLLALACLLAPRPAAAWWEASLQQVDVDITLRSNGVATVTYDLRYHVDRGRFEGPTIGDPGRELRWDRFNSYVEDSHGRRSPVVITRRNRDGAYTVRIQGEGIGPGWATVRLVHDEDLLDCCLRLDDQDRARLSWSALVWDVGMDRMTVRIRLEPAAAGVELEPGADEEFRVETTPEGELVVERIRPVRWYRMQVGLLLPADWLQRRPQRLAEDDLADLPDEQEAAPVIPPEPSQPTARGSQQSIALIFLLATGLACTALVMFKAWLTARGYHRRVGASSMLLLPKVPRALRWTFVAAFMLAGAWLQARSYLAAGALAFSAGLLLSLRAPARGLAVASRSRPTSWRDVGLDALAAMAGERARGRRRWASLADGTTPAGLPIAVLAVAGAAALVALTYDLLGGLSADGLAIDLGLTVAALAFTARRADAIPCRGAGAAALLLAVSRKLAARNPAQTAVARVLVAEGAAPESEGAEVRLELRPEEPGAGRVEIRAEPRQGVAGWSLALVADVTGPGGAVSTVRARRAGAIARRVGRTLGRIERSAAASS
jgi:hypothetical protein